MEAVQEAARELLATLGNLAGLERCFKCFGVVLVIHDVSFNAESRLGYCPGRCWW
jgi:hypothetical protein